MNLTVFKDFSAMGPRELSVDGFGVEKKVLEPMPASCGRAMKADSRIQDTLCPTISAGRVAAGRLGAQAGKHSHRRMASRAS